MSSLPQVLSIGEWMIESYFDNVNQFYQLIFPTVVYEKAPLQHNFDNT